MSFSIRASQGVLPGVSGPGLARRLGGAATGVSLRAPARRPAGVLCRPAAVHLPWGPHPGCAPLGLLVVRQGAALWRIPISDSLCWLPMSVGETSPSFSEALASRSSFLPSLPWQGSGLHCPSQAGAPPGRVLNVLSQRAGLDPVIVQEQRGGPARLAVTVRPTVKQRESEGREHIVSPEQRIIYRRDITGVRTWGWS